MQVIPVSVKVSWTTNGNILSTIEDLRPLPGNCVQKDLSQRWKMDAMEAKTKHVDRNSSGVLDSNLK